MSKCVEYYVAIILFSFVSNGIGFYQEVLLGNISHVKNGRKPEAGAAIFPVIPVSQIFYIGLVWGGDKVYPGAGFIAALILITCLSV